MNLVVEPVVCIEPLLVKPVRVPRLVIFGCAAVPTVPYIVSKYAFANLVALAPIL